MTLSEFLSLSGPQQVEMIRKGAAVADRYDEQYHILLFQVDGFYIEIFCHVQYSEVLRLRLFSDVDELTPYLEEIDIDELLL